MNEAERRFLETISSDDEDDEIFRSDDESVTEEQPKNKSPNASGGNIELHPPPALDAANHTKISRMESIRKKRALPLSRNVPRTIPPLTSKKQKSSETNTTKNDDNPTFSNKTSTKPPPKPEAIALTEQVCSCPRQSMKVAPKNQTEVTINELKSGPSKVAPSRRQKSSKLATRRTFKYQRTSYGVNPRDRSSQEYKEKFCNKRKEESSRREFSSNDNGLYSLSVDAYGMVREAENVSKISSCYIPSRSQAAYPGNYLGHDYVQNHTTMTIWEEALATARPCHDSFSFAPVPSLQESGTRTMMLSGPKVTPLGIASGMTASVPLVDYPSLARENALSSRFNSPMGDISVWTTHGIPTLSQVPEGFTSSVVVDKLGMNDVLFGKGMFCQKIPGNIKFRELIEQRQAHYDSAERKSMKSFVVSEVVTTIKKIRKGRFLECVNLFGGPECWLGLTDGRAREKVALCFQSMRRTPRVQEEWKNNDHEA
ncbi:hypothetical protein IV203_031128 [Nitzschia inconspicua]|uniref:DUF6824 domain-containing protein n=1 Tax=Nitzschia inconspicua TaxID=303405 RepID=A0A9K3LV27_9STRA|nr:hypothetical protein IV203_031128 [Nitzschia inconspicua]